MTNIGQLIDINRVTGRLRSLKWYGLSLHPYVSFCCRFPQRDSSLTHLPRSTQKIFNQLQCSWWSHCLASFLPQLRVRSISSCSESTLMGQNGPLSKDQSQHGLCCSCIEIGEHNHNRSQPPSLSRSIQRMVLGATSPMDSVADAQIIRAQVLLLPNEAIESNHVVNKYNDYEPESAAQKAHIRYSKKANGLIARSINGGHHGELEGQSENS